MVYGQSSIDEVIGRVVRRTRVQDSSYLLDAKIWIPEAMGLMRTKVEVGHFWKDVDIEFHRGETPCGTIDIKVVEWNGHRLARGNGSRTIGAPHNNNNQGSQRVFQSIQTIRFTPNETIIYDSTAIPLRTCSWQEAGQLPPCEQYFFTELGSISTSFRDGCIRVHYTGIILDENGFPRIPDNENYKEALYWFIRAQMIASGWEDQVFRYDYCDNKFKEYAGYAIGQIRYPSVDSMEAKVNATTHLIPPQDYFENFFSTPNPTF